MPAFAHDPLSGDGASRYGGRWNAVGRPCLYAALELSTAWSEYNQGLVQHPALLVRLVLTGARLADLRTRRDREAFGVTERSLDDDWRQELEDGREPESHRVARAVVTADHHGLVYPSAMSRGGTCVAVLRWNGPDEPRLTAIDPEGRLPRGPASWL